MVKKRLLIIFFFLGISKYVNANFDFNDNCIKAYEAIFDLRINDAHNILKEEKLKHPDNGITILLDNYIDYFSILVSENKADYDRLKSNKTTRLKQLATQDKNSPYYLFAQAEINLQWGMLKSRFQDYFSSGLDIKKADNLLKENERKFPDFLPNKKSLGLINVMLGAIPSNMKGVLQTFGFKGNVSQGIKTLESLTQTLPKSQYGFYKDEVVFFLCYIETDIVHSGSNYDKIIRLTHTMGDNSLLKAYLQGYVSYRNAQNDASITYLVKRPKGSNYIDFPMINYLLGNAKLNRNDADANVYLNRFIKESEGINYIKDAYLKLAYYYYLKNDINTYNSYIKMVQTKGNVYDEKDKQALKEANDGKPNIYLLKARFYFDGGYYNKALAQFHKRPMSDFNNQKDQIELFYRMGRIYDKMGKDSEAVTNYQKTIDLGKQATYYYAANAALSLGDMYAKKNDKGKAANYYRQAIAMKNHEYENSIENKAKDGLKRIGY